jgi:hypothetical protein
MFIETAIAMFVLGVIAGAWIVQLLRADTLHSENLALKQQQANRSWEREREAIQYQAFKNTHRGTPYLPQTPDIHEVAGRSVAHLDDNDRWSLKAPELRSVS